MENFGFKIIEARDAHAMNPQIAEIAVQLKASEENYEKALADLDSANAGVREEARIYLTRHQEYLMDAADTIMREGFSNPEERDVEGGVSSRLGILFEKLNS